MSDEKDSPTIDNKNKNKVDDRNVFDKKEIADKMNISNKMNILDKNNALDVKNKLEDGFSFLVRVIFCCIQVAKCILL
jgi:hypothetical protein